MLEELERWHGIWKLVMTGARRKAVLLQRSSAESLAPRPPEKSAREYTTGKGDVTADRCTPRLKFIINYWEQWRCLSDVLYI